MRWAASRGYGRIVFADANRRYFLSTRAACDATSRPDAPGTDGLALFERRLCRRHPILGEALEGAVEAASE
jgi:hypothetical protein